MVPQINNVPHANNSFFNRLLIMLFGKAMRNIEQFEEMAAVNSELRFITLELMKIAASGNKPFDAVLKDFTANAFKLKKTLSKEIPREEKEGKKSRKQIS